MLLKIRAAGKKDLKTCARILSEEFNKQGEKWTFKSALAYLTDLFDGGGPCYCLLLGNKIIGFAFCETFVFREGKHLMIEELAICVDHQDRGYGTKIIKFIERLAKKSKIKKIIVITSTTQRAIKLYKKLGFNETDEKVLEKQI